MGKVSAQLGSCEHLNSLVVSSHGVAEEGVAMAGHGRPEGTACSRVSGELKKAKVLVDLLGPDDESRVAAKEQDGFLSSHG